MALYMALYPIVYRTHLRLPWPLLSDTELSSVSVSSEIWFIVVSKNG
jgi:hypothetical protein